jgi:hypothetical protein
VQFIDESDSYYSINSTTAKQDSLDSIESLDSLETSNKTLHDLRIT